MQHIGSYFKGIGTKSLVALGCFLTATALFIDTYNLQHRIWNPDGMGTSMHIFGFAEIFDKISYDSAQLYAYIFWGIILLLYGTAMYLTISLIKQNSKSSRTSNGTFNSSAVKRKSF